MSRELRYLIAKNTPESVKRARELADRSGVQMEDAGDVDGHYNGLPFATYYDCFKEDFRFETFSSTPLDSALNPKPLGRWIKDASGRRSKLYNSHLVMLPKGRAGINYIESLDLILIEGAKFGITPVYDTKNRIEHNGILYASKSYAFMSEPFAMPVPPAPFIIP